VGGGCFRMRVGCKVVELCGAVMNTLWHG
jgi:hypothetical protein